jgi:glycine/D-amino acid oxidase-like deaminating enzyme
MADIALKQRPCWIDAVAMPPGDATTPLPEAIDVAVIGGGITGLAAARVIAQRGARVAVLEAESLGWGASSRNGGMVLTGLKLAPETLIARYGLELAKRMYAASLAALDLVEQLVNEEKIDCDFARSGHLELAYKRRHFAELQRTAIFIESVFGRRLHLVPRKDLAAEIGSKAYHGGLVDPMSAGLNPARYVAGLARAAARAGAILLEHTRVERVQPEMRSGAAGYRLSTVRGAVWARDVLVATSGYTGPATPALQRKIVPIGSYIVVTEPLTEEQARAASPRNRMMYDTKNFLYYFRLTPDQRMLFGGRAAFLPETSATITKSARILGRALRKVYPALRKVRLEYVWGGTLDFAFDTMPHAGQLDGLYYALGYAGHGVALATYLGTQVGKAVLGEKPENPFAEIRFPGAPFGLYNGRPWFLPFAGAWYKLRDWVS